MEKIVNNLTSCSHPSRIVNKATGELIFVPCGHCSSCRDSYTKNWISRLEAETRDSTSTLFFTLTYDNDHIPTVLHDGNVFTSQCGNRVNDFIIPQSDYKQYFENGTNWTNLYVRESRGSNSKKAFEISVNSKRDMQLFLKRLRRYVSRDKHHLLDSVSQSDRQIRYFLTTEYGPNSFRTHAHGLLWFKTEKLLNPLLTITSMRVGNLVLKSDKISALSSKMPLGMWRSMFLVTLAFRLYYRPSIRKLFIYFPAGRLLVSLLIAWILCLVCSRSQILIILRRLTVTPMESMIYSYGMNADFYNIGFQTCYGRLAYLVTSCEGLLMMLYHTLTEKDSSI